MIALFLFLLWHAPTASADVWAAMSQGSARLWGAGACANVDTSTSLSAVQSSYQCLMSPASLTTQASLLREVRNQAITETENGFFASLAVQHSRELDCSAAFAEKLANTDGEARSNIKLRIQALREVKQRLVKASMALSKPPFSGRPCPLSMDDLKPDPIDVALRGQDPTYELCKEVLLTRTAYDTIFHSIPLSGTPSVNSMLEKFANMAEDESLRDMTNNLDSVIAKSYGEASSALKNSAVGLKQQAQSGGGEINRSTRYALMSDPLVVNKVISSAGPANKETMTGIACNADQRFHSGADALDRTVLVGSLVVSGGATVLLRVGSMGARLAAGANSARASGLMSLNTARMIEQAAAAVAFSAELAPALAGIHKACFANGWKAQGTDDNQQCVSAPTIEQLQQDSCATGAVLGGMGIVTAISPLALNRLGAFGTPLRATGQLSAEARTATASTLLSRPLTESQSRAVISAHEVGRGELGINGTVAAIGNYTPAHLRHKAQILQAAGFNTNETRLLMENGVVGDVVNIGSVTRAGALPPVWPAKTQTDFNAAYDVAKSANVGLRRMDPNSIPVSMPEIQAAIASKYGLRGSALVPKITTQSGKVIMTYEGQLGKQIVVNLNASNGQNYYTITERMNGSSPVYLKLTPRGNGRDGAGWTGLGSCRDMADCHYAAVGF